MNAPCRQVVLIALTVVGLAYPLGAQDWARVEVRTIPVADNVYLLAGAGGNIALSTGEDGALLVDAGYEQLAGKIDAAVRRVAQAPARLVINTHWHFDHVGGNQHLRQAGALIVAHENVRRRMSQDRFITVIERQVPPSPSEALPMLTVTESLTLHWNGDQVEVHPVGPAHTDGDSIVHFRKANVLHLGDICFNGMYPFFDVNAGGSLDGLVQALDQALALAGDKTRIIPGHGPLTDAAGLRTYRNTLATVRDRVRGLVQQGKSRAEVIADKPTREFDAQWGQSWLDADTWVGLIYDGMMGK